MSQALATVVTTQAHLIALCNARPLYAWPNVGHDTGLSLTTVQHTAGAFAIYLGRPYTQEDLWMLPSYFTEGDDLIARRCNYLNDLHTALVANQNNALYPLLLQELECWEKHDDGMLDRVVNPLIPTLERADTGVHWHWQGKHTQRGFTVNYRGYQNVPVYRLLWSRLRWMQPISAANRPQRRCEDEFCINPFHFEQAGLVRLQIRSDPTARRGHPGDMGLQWRFNLRRGDTTCPHGHSLSVKAQQMLSALPEDLSHQVYCGECRRHAKRVLGMDVRRRPATYEPLSDNDEAIVARMNARLDEINRSRNILRKEERGDFISLPGEHAIGEWTQQDEDYYQMILEMGKEDPAELAAAERFKVRRLGGSYTAPDDNVSPLDNEDDVVVD